MVTTTCTLTIGQRRAVAIVTTDSPQAEAVVTYTGDLDLLPTRFPTMDNADLRQMCKQAALASGAALKINDSGEFESWAE